MRLIGTDKCTVVPWELWSSCSAHKINIQPQGISQRRKGAKENHYRPQWPPPSPLKGELRRADKSLAVSSGYTGDLKPERLAYSSPGHRPGCSANILLQPYRGGISIQCKGMLPLQGAQCGGHFITQGVAVGLNYTGPSALKCVYPQSRGYHANTFLQYFTALRQAQGHHPLFNQPTTALNS